MATSSTQEASDEGTYTEWIDVQKKTFTNWVNEKLKDTPHKVQVLEKDLDDGVTLIKLLETLANKKMHKRYNAKPQLPIQRSDNLEIALEFITKVENIKLENIGVGDITHHNLTLILALVWALILRYQMARRQPDTVESKVVEEENRDETADELLLGWIRMALPGKNIENLTSEWSNGLNLSALVDYCKPGLIPNHASLDPKNRLENVQHVMALAEQQLNIPQVMYPEDLAVDHPDKLSTMTYLSQFWWRSRHQPTSPQQEIETCKGKRSLDTELLTTADPEMTLKEKEKELQLLKQQTEREKKELQAQLDVVIKRDMEHKKHIESVQREMEMQTHNTLTMQDEHRKQLELEKKELETKLEMERVLMEKELLIRDKQLKSVQLQLHSMHEELSADNNVLEAELRLEKMSKEQELQEREKKITEQRKELESVRKELEREKQKPPILQKGQVTETGSKTLETLSLQAFSTVDPALRKNHRAYFRGSFLLRTTVIINEQPAELGPNEQGWLTLRCPTTNAAVTFDDLYTKVSTAMQKYDGIKITNYWCSDVPLFQLNVSSTDSLQKLLRSKSKLQKELTEQISRLFKKTQVHLQPQVFLILPSASGGSGKIVHVTADNAAQSMAEWEGSAVFTFQDVFQQWDDHSRRNEPTLGTTSVRELVEALKEIVEWFQFGIHLEIPHYRLSIIKADNQDVEKCKIAMFQWWLENTIDAKWSTIVQALVKAGKKVLAHKIALDHGVPNADYSDLSEAAPTVEPTPHSVQSLREKVDKLEAKVRVKKEKLGQREKELHQSELQRERLTHEMSDIRKGVESAQSKIDGLLQEKKELEQILKKRDIEIEILKLTMREKEQNLVTAKEQEVAQVQKQLDFVKQELEAKRKKMTPLQEELQRKAAELTEKSFEIRFLKEARDSANSQLKMEKERAELKSKELTAAAISHAIFKTEVKLQLSSLEQNKQQSMKIIQGLQRIIRQKESEIKLLSQQITAKKVQQTDAARVLLELEHMKTRKTALEEEVSSLQGAAKLSQEEASGYQEIAEYLLRAVPTKLALKWSNRKRGPKPMYKGAAVVHGTIAYIIGYRSQIIYSYRLDRDKWNKHSECPHVNPGLIIINDLLTSVGGAVGDHPTNKLHTWKGSKWVEVFPPMQTPRERPAVVHHGDYVIAVGGDREERGVELLHVPSLLWSTVTSLPRHLSDISATVCEDSIIAMDYRGSAYMINVKSLNAPIQLEGSSTEHSQWSSLPRCPVGYGPTLSSLSGQCLALAHNGIFQLQERQWMVVVGGDPVSLTGYTTSTDAVRVAVIV